MDDAHQGSHRHVSTGIRTPIGIKVFGPDLRDIVDVNDQIARRPRGFASMNDLIAAAVEAGSKRVRPLLMVWPGFAVRARARARGMQAVSEGTPPVSSQQEPIAAVTE